MEIAEIKAQLSILTILDKYNLKVDKHHKTCCPFHKEKTPSFTVYPKTNSFHCFGCGVSGDTIEFIQLKEKCSKHEAILKASSFIGPLPELPKPRPQLEPKPQKPNPPQEQGGNEPTKELPRLAVMSKIMMDARANLKRTDNPQQYLKSRKLDPEESK